LDPRKRLTAAEKRRVLEELQAGGKVATVARQFGIDRGTVRRVREAQGRVQGGNAGSRQVVAARLSAEEVRVFDAVTKRCGCRSRSEALRALARSASGFVEFSREENAGLDEVARELNKIGVNVNQLARLANSGRLPAGGRQLDVMSDLRRELAQLRAFMLDLTAERRRRGTKLFAQYARAERANG
jgi:transposase-like protein